LLGALGEGSGWDLRTRPRDVPAAAAKKRERVQSTQGVKYKIKEMEISRMTVLPKEVGRVLISRENTIFTRF